MNNDNNNPTYKGKKSSEQNTHKPSATQLILNKDDVINSLNNILE